MQEKPSLLMIIFGVLFILLLTVTFLFIFYIDVVELIDGIYNHLDIIVFDKSAMYLLGGGVLFFNFFVVITYFFITDKQLLKNTKKNNVLFLLAKITPIRTPYHSTFEQRST